jgi:hypothetical protein
MESMERPSSYGAIVPDERAGTTAAIADIRILNAQPSSALVEVAADDGLVALRALA